MADLIGALSYDPSSVQGFTNVIFWIMIGIVALVIVVIVVVKIIQMLTYKTHVTAIRRVGHTEIQFEEWARVTKQDNYSYYQYKGLNKLSPIWDSKFNRIITKKVWGIFPRSYVGFTAIVEGDKIIPCMVTGTEGIKPFDWDMFNYMVQRIKAIMAKYTQQNFWLQIAPLIGIGLVVFMFVFGMIFYTKHVENVANMIMNKASDVSTQILEKTGGVQILQPK